MPASLTLLCHASTEAIRSGAFPRDEPLDARGLALTLAQVGGLGHFNRVLMSPTLRARQTAAALSLDAVVVPALADCDYGRWSGFALADLVRSEPDAVHAWQSDAEAAPHGGESIAALGRRISDWLEAERDGGPILAITHGAILRIAVVIALNAPSMAFWNVDAGPLATVSLTSNGRRWALRLSAP